MGFTRYWEFERLDLQKFKDFSSICQNIIDSMGIPLNDVIVNDFLVRFNGVNDDAHETFCFSAFKTGFNFCKTNVKPYDEVVCACLYVAKLAFKDDIRVNQDCLSSEDEDTIIKVKSILRNLKLNLIIE